MCGICGEIVLTPGEQVGSEALLAMRAAIDHRGPDGAGLFVSDDRRVGLAFRRLAIIDLSPAANQPMPNEDGAIQIVFNGEIYNFRELRAELTARGHRFRTRSDTEAIIHLYQDEGVDAFRRLDGMFALAIWDARKRHLVLARDRAGKKPLYMYRDRLRLAFASEIKAFFAHPDIPIEIDPDSIPTYFARGLRAAAADVLSRGRTGASGHRRGCRRARAHSRRRPTGRCRPPPGRFRKARRAPK